MMSTIPPTTGNVDLFPQHHRHNRTCHPKSQVPCPRIGLQPASSVPAIPFNETVACIIPRGSVKHMRLQTAARVKGDLDRSKLLSFLLEGNMQEQEGWVKCPGVMVMGSGFGFLISHLHRTKYKTPTRDDMDIRDWHQRRVLHVSHLFISCGAWSDRDEPKGPLSYFPRPERTEQLRATQASRL